MSELRDRLKRRFDQVDRVITHTMARYGVTVLRVAVGIVFIWFGGLKLLPDASPAEQLVRNTVYFVDPDWFIPVLGLWEVAIGVGLTFRIFMRLTLLLLFLQLPGTAMPIVVMPEVVWQQFPHALTIEGQYIVKNMVIVGAALVIGGTVRGGGLRPEPGEDESASPPLP